MNYCDECGTKLRKNTKFCPECGKKVNDMKTKGDTYKFRVLFLNSKEASFLPGGNIPS